MALCVYLIGMKSDYTWFYIAGKAKGALWRKVISGLSTFLINAKLPKKYSGSFGW